MEENGDDSSSMSRHSLGARVKEPRKQRVVVIFFFKTSSIFIGAAMHTPLPLHAGSATGSLWFFSCSDEHYIHNTTHGKKHVFPRAKYFQQNILFRYMLAKRFLLFSVNLQTCWQIMF